MKILFITHLNPFNSSFGAEQRTHLALTSLLSIGHSIDIAYIGQTDKEPIKLPHNCKIIFWNTKEQIEESRLNRFKCLTLISAFPKNKYLTAQIKFLISKNKYDLIFCRYIPFATKVGLKPYADKLLLDIDDLPVQALQIDFSNKKGFKKLYFNLLKKLYIKETKWWIKNAKECYIPNLKQANNLHITYLPNISIIRNNKPPIIQNQFKILFIGKLDWLPNLNGIEAFILNCWNEIKQKIPEAELIIAGKGLPKDKELFWSNNYKGITIKGFVQDLSTFYNEGNIVISPIYSGAGTNIKIIEACSMAKVCVLSKESSKGFEHFLKSGENCYIVEDFNHFSETIINLLLNFDTQKEIGEKAYQSAITSYSTATLSFILSKSTT